MENGSYATSVDTIRSFRKPGFSILTSLVNELKVVFKDVRSRKVTALLLITFFTLTVLFSWSASTNSMALKSFTYLILFDLFGLCICLLSIWIESSKLSSSFTFGYERFEVLAIFSSTILVQIGSLFVVKECCSRILEQPDVHTGRLLIGTVTVFFCHMLVMYGQKNKSLSHVVEASSSSWLQEHVAEICQSLCHFVPGFSSFLLPRINPFALVAAFGSTALIVTSLLIDMEQYHGADTIAAMCITVVMIATMYPVSVYTGNILLQTMPAHIVGQLDKCLREALTLDGVLEFRKEHFWTLSFGKLAGSLHVRIRRDANEQLVLAHLLERLTGLVSVITIQIFKDDWTRTSTLQILSDTDLGNMKLAPRIPPVVPSTIHAASAMNNSSASIYANASSAASTPRILIPKIT